MLADRVRQTSGGVKVPDLAVLLMHFDDNLVNEVTGGVLNSSNVSTFGTGVFGKGLDSKQPNTSAEVQCGNIDFDNTWTLEFLLNIINAKYYTAEYFWITWNNPNVGTDGKFGSITVYIGQTLASGTWIRVIINDDSGNSGMSHDTSNLLIATSATKVKVKIWCNSGSTMFLGVQDQSGTIILNQQIMNRTSTYWSSASARQLKIKPYLREYGTALLANTIVMDEFLLRMGIADSGFGFPTAPY